MVHLQLVDNYNSTEVERRISIIGTDWFDALQGASTLENVNAWRWKLTMLLRDKNEQEVVSRDKKDRRDFEQLSTLATRMGLYRYLNSWHA